MSEAIGPLHTDYNSLTQGSSPSPTLCNIYTVPPQDVKSVNCYLLQFAEDFMMIAFDSDVEVAKTIL